ncbi:MAG TPA: selenium-dependent molybdenum cofactor biosynthesis protein YqeB [Anaerolineae bacterium]|nr:selenium-dependent molybdenum cofactor biosynthesis protein YqeB [Anaerolineae bacterium]
MSERLLVAVRGGGDLGTGVALRLQRAHFRVVVLEAPQPTVIRRAVAFAAAVYDGSVAVEDTTARLARFDDDLASIGARGEVPVLVDPQAASLSRLRPAALVDAIMAKRNTGTRIDAAPIVVALGPGFVAGGDCHAVVETNRGHSLGRVYYSGSAQADTGTPGTLGSEDAKRALRAPGGGEFRALKKIGERVTKGEVVGRVGELPIAAQIAGVLRGVLHDGLTVSAGMKVADVDPRGMAEHCFTVSDKSWAVGGGVLEAVLHLRRI